MRITRNEPPALARPIDPPRPSLLRRFWPPALTLLMLVLLWVASDIAVPAALSSWTGRLQGFVTIFFGIFIEALPFLMAGVFVSSAIHLYVSAERIQRLSPRQPLLAALTGALLGMVFPVCECGSIPATRRLLSKGAALPMGISFALAAPVINPVVLISTYVAFSSWEMVAWRAGLTLLIAVIVGLLVGTPARPEQILVPGVFHQDDHQHCDHEHGHCDHEPDNPKATPLLRVLNHSTSEFFEMVRYLIIGALLAATLQTIVPQQALLALGDGPVLSVLVLIALAVVLSICSTVDSFIALSFVNTFTRGSILAFLVFGPMIDIKSTLMLTSTFNRRTVGIIVLLCFQLALLAGIVVNFFLL